MASQLRNWFFTVTATATAVGTRFLQTDKPTQATMQNLCDSIPFKLEPNDKAGNSSQGLVRTVSDANAKTCTAPDTTWSYVPKVTQLPTLENESQTIPATNDVPIFNGAIIDNAADSTTTRNNYKPKASSDLITWLITHVLTRLIKSGGSTGQVLAKASNTNYDVAWTSAVSLPTGGSTGQVLKKNSGTNYDASFADQYPSFTGNANKTLRVNVGETGVEWAASAAQTNVPTGGIIMYEGSFSNFDGTGLGVSALAGWALCNGNNGTSNLSGKFIVGYSGSDPDYSTIGNTGGAKTVALTAAQNGPHTHGYEDNGVSGTVNGISHDTGPGSPPVVTINSADTVRTTASSGSGDPHENRPPYYTLAYIKRIS